MEDIYTYTPGVAGQTGTLTVTLQSTTDQGVYVRTACTDVSTESACRDSESGGTNEVLNTVVQGGQPLFIIVDGIGAGVAGPYTLDVSFNAATCGDMTITAPEECDDGNTMSGDGCDASCKIEPAFYCAMAMPAQATNAGDTTDGTSVFQGSCTGGGAKEELYTFTPA